MESLKIPGTDENPEITLDPQNNIFEISGRSLPEEVLQFYAPVYKWMEEYVKNPLENTVLKLKIVYMNSPSQKALLEIINIVEKITDTGKKIKIEWHYHEDDEDMLESGKEFEELSDILFEFRSYS